MDYKSKIMSEVEALPESLLPELFTYVKTLQPKVAAPTKSKLTIKPKSPSQISSSVAGDTIIIYTDGACTGNPGKGGYGAVIIDSDCREELSAGYKLTTNNRMEMMGAIAALESLKSNSKVKLHSDSKYLVDAMVKGWAKKWQANGWRRNSKEMAKNPDLWQELLDLCKIHDVEFVWVKAHAGIVENERCDRLAVAAAQGSNLITDRGYQG
jgi:ribonuclease HI